jgi:3'-5' exoribonuclease
MKQTFIDMLKAGHLVDDIFVGQDKQLAHKKNGEPYLTLTMADRSGTMRAVVWDNVEAVNRGFVSGDYVKVAGNVSQYKDQLQVVVRRLTPADPNSIDARDFLPTVDRDVEKMLDQLLQIVGSVKNPHLSGLLDAFFRDEFFVARFKKAPAAKKMHHAYLGGLLEHTLSICRLIQALSNHYKGVDYDILLTGGVLHDIGKIHEFSYEAQIDYSDSGRLLNHIVLGVEMLEKKIQTLRDFPDDLGLLLKHMIVSHHGTREFGSPEPPKTLEAIILNHLDDLDAKVTGVRTFMEREESEDAWTSYHRVMDRFFYKGTTKKNLPDD